MTKDINKYLNKVVCGDCYKLIKEIPDKSIDLIITDPPYQFCMGGKGKSKLGSRKFKQKIEIYNLDTERTKENGKNEESERLRIISNTLANGKNTQFISKGITNDILDEMVRVLKKINIYIRCNKEQLRQLIDYFDDLGCFIDLLSWHKTNPIPTCNDTYLPDTEYLIFAREKGVKLNGCYDTKHKYYVSEINVSDKKLYDHPTIKPLNIIKNLVINSSNENDVILDPFIGSGTTAVACKELGRNYIGFELNEHFHQIAVDRVNGIKQCEKKFGIDQLKLF